MELSNTYEISSYNFTRFVESFDKLRKAAIKCGCEAPTYDVEGPFYKKVRGNLNDDDMYEIEYQEVTVHGTAPKMGDYTVIAKVDNLGEDNIIRGADHVETRFRHTGTICEHCNTKRNRVYLYVLEDEAGKQFQVGKSCLKDFVGHASPERIASYFEHYIEEDFSEYTGIPWETVVERDLYLRSVAATIHAFGWMSKGQAWETGERATAQIADDFYGWQFMGKRPANDYEAETYRQVRDAMRESDVELVAGTVAWAIGLTDEQVERSNYLYNLRSLFKSELVDIKHLGFAASAVFSYQREQEKQAERSRQNELCQSKHMGEVKERLRDLTVDVLSCREMDSEFGVTYLIKMVSEGNVLVWFGSGMNAEELAEKVGETVVIDATVKSHNTFNNRSETQVNRVTVHAS